jgi:hypothetical protein
MSWRPGTIRGRHHLGAQGRHHRNSHAGQNLTGERNWGHNCPQFLSPSFLQLIARRSSPNPTREQVRLGWFQSQELACCRSDKLLFRIRANASYVPRMLSTVRCDMERGRGCCAFDERWRLSPRDRRYGEPDQKHEWVTQSVRGADHGLSPQVNRWWSRFNAKQLVPV